MSILPLRFNLPYSEELAGTLTEYTRISTLPVKNYQIFVTASDISVHTILEKQLDNIASYLKGCLPNLYIPTPEIVYRIDREGNLTAAKIRLEFEASRFNFERLKENLTRRQCKAVIDKINTDSHRVMIIGSAHRFLGIENEIESFGTVNDLKAEILSD
jgi:hypothetical protein